MTGEREFELKFELNPDALDRLRHSTLTQGAGRAPTRLLRSIYFDTHEQDLRRAGMTLRVRRVGSRHVQTVKAGESTVDRREWETDLRTSHPDVEAACRTLARRVLERRKVRDGLKPLIAVHVQRSAWLLDKDGSEVELAIDRGAVRAGDREAPICEAELELKSGPADALFDCAAELAVAGGRLSFVSKSERGYRLISGTAEAMLRLQPGMTVEAALRRIVHAGLAQIFDNQAVLVERHEPVALHQVRVGLRRVRTALALFKPLLRHDAAYEPIRSDLRWLSGTLGSLRDLDVLRDSAGRRLAAGPIPGRAALLSLIDSRRAQAYADLQAVLTSPRFAQLGIATLRLVEAGDWLRDERRQARKLRTQRIEKFAGKVLALWTRRLLKKSRRLSSLGEKALHDVRIAAKKLRYTVEFMEGLATRPRIARTAGRFKAIQDMLGDINDQAVQGKLLGALTEMHPDASGQAMFAAGALSVSPAANERKLISAVRKARRGVSRATPFWASW